MLLRKILVNLFFLFIFMFYKIDVNEKLRKCGLLKGEYVSLRILDFFRGMYKYLE